MPVSYAHVNAMHVVPAPPHRPNENVSAYAYNGESRFEVDSDDEWRDKRVVYKYGLSLSHIFSSDML